MSRIETLETLVHQAYDAKNPERADWSDWLGDNHVFVVADNASKLAQRFGANEELARAAALLHDIADTRMKRFDDNHETTTLEIARDFLQQAGFNADEIALVADDAVRWHSCHDDKTPDSVEGKVLATADSQAHLQTDFYIYATWALGKEKSLPDVKSYVLKKIDRDFYNKILFDEIRQECQADYDRLKTLFSR